jgi:thiol-disulfide isomerase/thioredoxin
MWDRILPAILLVAVVVAAGLFVYWGSIKPSEFPPPDQLQVLGTVPASWTVTGLDGKEVSAGDLRGKVLFINHWATWCPPCMAEMPHIQKLHDSLKGATVEFLIVSGEKAEKVREVADAKGWTMPIYTNEGRFPPVLETQGIPDTFIVNRKGEVVFRKVGYHEWNTDDARNFLTNIP